MTAQKSNTKKASVTPTATAKPVIAKKPVITSEHIKTVTDKLNKQAAEMESKINHPMEVSKAKGATVVFNGLCRQIRSELGKVEGSYLKVAFSIYRIHVDRMYTYDGFKNIYDFAKAQFGLSRGTCHNFVTIIDKFGKRDGSGILLNELVDEVKSYKSTQLILMSGMDRKQIADCNPDMTCEELKRKLKDASKLILDKPSSVSPVLSDSDNSDDDNVIDSTAKEVKRQTLIICSDAADYDTKIDKIDSLIRRVFENSKRPVKVEISYTWSE